MNLHRTRLLAPLCAAALIACRGPAQADDGAARRTLEGRYARLARVFRAADTNGTIRFYEQNTTSDYAWLWPGGKREGLKIWIGTLREQGLRPGIRRRLVLERLAVQESQAVAVVDLQVAGGNLLLQDMWAKTARGWKLQRTGLFHDTLIARAPRR